MLNKQGPFCSYIGSLASRADFASEPSNFVVTVMGSGGWDATMFCGPKGNTPQDSISLLSQTNSYQSQNVYI